MEILEKLPTDQRRQIMYTIQTNPLLIDTVVSTLLSLVDYENLKECRLVCTKWKEFSDTLLILRSAFVVNGHSKSKIVKESFTKPPEDIQSLFLSINQEYHKVRFRAFKFKVQTFSSVVRQLYLDPYKVTMTQLEISANNILDANKMKNTNVDDLIGPNLIKLKLKAVDVANHFKSAPFQVSLDKIASIRHIDLDNCNLILNPGVKIAPVELALAACEFMTQVSDFIDFHFLQKLHLSFSGHLKRINWSDCKNIKDLNLKGVNINLEGEISPEELTLEENRYEVNGRRGHNILLLRYIKATATTPMKKIRIIDMDRYSRLNLDNFLNVDELRIRGANVTVMNMFRYANIKKVMLTPGFDNLLARLEISTLPEMLETLSLDFYSDECATFTKPIFLPKLKHLTIGKELHHLSKFKMCPSLEYVSLANTYCHFVDRGTKTIDVDNFPPNTKGLSLKNILRFKLACNGTLKLDVLMISVVSNEYVYVIPYSLKQFRRKVQADLVLLYACPNSFNSFSKTVLRQGYVVKVMEVKQRFGLGNIALGPVEWDDETNFSNSVLFKFVDRISEYYLFEGQNGKAISEKDFILMIPLPFRE